MRSRIIVNLLLVAGIVLLGLIARYEPGLEKKAETAPITALKPAQIHRIHLNRPIRDDLVLRRTDADGWEIKGPVPLPGDAQKISMLTRLAEQRPARSYAAADMDLEALHLDPPYASAILNDTAIEFGSLDPIDQLRYVRVNDVVFLIPATYLPLIEAGFTDFVRLRLFDQKAKIAAIHLPRFSVSRSDGTWHTDLAHQPDSATLQQFVSLWETAAALGVQPADPEQAGDAIGIRFRGETDTVQLQIVQRQPELILSRPAWGIQYRMGNRSEALLSLDAASADVKD